MRSPRASAASDYSIGALRAQLVGRKLTSRAVAAHGLAPADKGKWGKVIEKILGIAQNSLPSPDLGADGELKTAVRRTDGQFREALRICTVAHDPLVKLSKIALVVLRDLNDSERLGEREVKVEDVHLLVPTMLITHILKADHERLRRDLRSRDTFFLETHPQNATLAYYIKKQRLQQYVDEMVRAWAFKPVFDALMSHRRISPADLRRAEYRSSNKGRFGHYLRRLLPAAFRGAVASGVVLPSGRAKEDLLICRDEDDPVTGLERLVYVPMRAYRSGASREEGREVTDVIYLAPNSLVVHALERDKQLIRRGRPRDAFFLRLKSHATTGQKGLSWYLKANAVDLYSRVLRNQPL